ncbi:MAG: hypothetical protein ACKV2U_24010 [Bryobacteraceae bacterium]
MRKSTFSLPLLFAACCLALSTPALAQAARDPVRINAAIARFKADIADRARTPFFGGAANNFEAAVDLRNLEKWAHFLAAYDASLPGGTELDVAAAGGQRAFDRYLSLYSAKTETQAGSASGNGGTTSLALKGGVAQILSFATENGGLTREQNGTTVTFRGKPIGIVKALNKQDFFQILTGIENDAAAKFWDRFSLAASFDTSRGGVSNTLLANSKQLTSWSVRAELVNRRSAAHRTYAKNWREVNNRLGLTLLKDDQAIIAAAKKDQRFNDWHDKLLKRAIDIDKEIESEANKNSSAPDAKEKNARFFTQRLTEFQTEFELHAVKLDLPAGLLAPSVKPLLGSWTKLREEAVKIEDQAQRGRLATLDLTTKRDDALPDLYTMTFVYENAPFAGKTHDFTVNAAASVYRTEPPAPSTANRFKSFDAVAQYDIPLGEIKSLGKAILTFAGKFQYVGASVTRVSALTAEISTAAASPPVADNGAPLAVPNLRGLIPTIEGPLGLFQAKFSIPVKGGGIRIPFAFTAATRSEAFQKADYRALVGITFDLDSIFAKESAKKE